MGNNIVKEFKRIFSRIMITSEKTIYTWEHYSSLENTFDLLELP